TVLNDLRINTHGRTDRRNTKGHVLQGLEAAFPFTPLIVRQRHQANVDRTQILDLSLGTPLNRLCIHTIKFVIRSSDNAEPEFLILCERLQSAPDRIKMLHSAVAAAPTDR